MMSGQPRHYTSNSVNPMNMMAGSMMTSSGESTVRELQRRQASSTILKEEYLSQLPEPEIRYVEVPVYEEVIKRVPKKEIIEVERVVPKTEVEWVDRIVEIPQIQYIDRQIEVPQIHEVLRQVTKHEIIDVPREVVRHVPKVETVIVEKVVEVPGQIVEVPKPYIVENKIPVPRYVDNEVPMVVAQTIRPIITESREPVDVDVFEYEPQVVVVDVHVPKPIPSQLIAGGMVEDLHQIVTVPVAQYNSMLKMLNVHINENDQRSTLPFITETSGAIPMLHGAEAHMMYPAPVATAQIQGYIPGTASSQHFVTTSTSRGLLPTTHVGPTRVTTSGATSTTSKVVGRHLMTRVS